MSRISRRKLIVGAIAVPAFSPLNVPGAAPPVAGADAFLVQAARWISTNERLAAMEQEWRDLESCLFDKAALLKIDCLAAGRSSLPEARALRTLGRRIKATYRKQELLAEKVSHIPATTMAGVLAKIELGLKVQGPYDWNDHALELLEGGIAEMRVLLHSVSGGEFSSFR